MATKGYHDWNAMKQPIPAGFVTFVTTSCAYKRAPVCTSRGPVREVVT